MQAVDSLIAARWIIPVVPAGKRLENHVLVIQEGRIAAICPADEAALRYRPQTTVNLASHALIPGLINGHTHAAMSLMRGIADDLPLMTWLNEEIWPRELRWVDEEFVQTGTCLALAEMIRSGTTCFNDMYFYPDITANVVKQTGLRATLGLIFVDFPTPWARSPEEYFDKNLALYRSCPRDDKVQWLLAPHAPYSVSNAMFEKIGEISAEYGLKVHMHLHETANEIEASLDRFQSRPLDRIERLGLLNERLIAVHMVHVDDEECRRIAAAGAGVVHCPESNLKLGSGLAPVAKFLEASAAVSLGTDGAASNNDLDLIGEMQTAALLAKGVSGDPESLPAEQALALATIDGAGILGLDHQIGSLEVGKFADVVAIDLSAPETQPLYDPLAQIVYAAGREQVTDVWVNGQRLLAERQLTTIDWPALNAQVKDWQERLKKPLL